MDKPKDKPKVLIQDSPDWFPLTEGENQYTLEQWFGALIVRRQYWEQYLWHSDAGQTAIDSSIAESLWQNYQSDLRVLPTAPRWPSVRILREDYSLPELPVLDLDVNLNAPDALIRIQFEAILAKARTRYPSPIAPAGRRPKADTRKITRPPVETWVGYRILSLFDLWYWRHLFNTGTTYSLIGGWLYGPEYDPAKRTDDALRKMFEAFAQIEAIPAYLTHFPENSSESG